MGRGKDAGSRRSKAERKRAQREAEKAARALAQGMVAAPDRVEVRRATFAFVTPTAGPDGRVGKIDQDICDGIGQLHALGLLDGHGHEALVLRDHGREWGHHLATLLAGVGGVRVSEYERRSVSRTVPVETAADRRWDILDAALSGFERRVLFDLIVVPLIGISAHDREVTPWAQSLIDEALLKRGRAKAMMRFPDSHDRELLAASLRGMCQLVDAGLPARFERKAA